MLQKKATIFCSKNNFTSHQDKLRDGDFFSAIKQESRQRLDTEKQVVRAKRRLLMKILMSSNAEGSYKVNGAQPLHHFTDYILQQSEQPVAGPSNSSSALSYSQTDGRGASNEPPSQLAIPQFFQKIGEGSWRDRVTGAIRKVLDRLGTVKGVTSMTEEVRAALGEEGADDLAQHLLDTESDLTVADFVHMCFWNGVACGLWRKMGDTWRRLEL